MFYIYLSVLRTLKNQKYETRLLVVKINFLFFYFLLFKTRINQIVEFNKCTYENYTDGNMNGLEYDWLYERKMNGNMNGIEEFIFYLIFFKNQ
jgi:hypothetical protein